MQAQKKLFLGELWGLTIEKISKIALKKRVFLVLIITKFDLKKALYDRFLGLQKILWSYFFQQSYLRP